MAIFNRLVQPNLTTVYTRTHARTHANIHIHTAERVWSHKILREWRTAGSSSLLWHTCSRTRAPTHTHTHKITRTIILTQGIRFMPLPRSWSWITLSAWNFGIWAAAILNGDVVTTWNFRIVFVIRRPFKWAPTRSLVQFKFFNLPFTPPYLGVKDDGIHVKG